LDARCCTPDVMLLGQSAHALSCAAESQRLFLRYCNSSTAFTLPRDKHRKPTLFLVEFERMLFDLRVIPESLSKVQVARAFYQVFFVQWFLFVIKFS